MDQFWRILMIRLFKITLSILSATTFGLASAATSAPPPNALWKNIKLLQEHHSLMLGSHAFQPGSRVVDVYTTDLANARENEAVRRAGSVAAVTRYPDGSLVVKENYDAHKKLTGVTAMLKLKGYDRADRDWVMAAYKPDGQVVSYGKVQACIACHAMVLKQAADPAAARAFVRFLASPAGQKIFRQYGYDPGKGPTI